MSIKSSPLDIESFRQETSVKYPTFTPAPQPAPPPEPPVVHPKPQIQTYRLAQAYSPIPVRHHYHHDDSESHHPSQHPNPHTHPFHPQGPSGSYRPNPQPATPAPSPPASPKPKKQQYQTDQNRPFLFPFSSKSRYKDGKLVPFAIDEADKLFNKHMYVSAALWQMWKTRQDCMTAESGLEHMPGSEGTPEPVNAPSDVSRSFTDLCLWTYVYGRTRNLGNLWLMLHYWMRRLLKQRLR
jgi:hypothetical protein